MKLIFAIFIASTWVTQAATLAQLHARVNDWLESRWPIVVARQDQFFATHGKYWQGLLTHSAAPSHTTADDSDSIPDRLTTNPLGNTQTWLDVFPEWSGVNIPAAVKVDVYDGPNGKGWSATIWIQHNGVLYSRTRQVGAETHRNIDWHIVTESVD